MLSNLLHEFTIAVRESTIKRLVKVPEGYENWKISRGALSFSQQARHLIDLDYWTIDKIKNPSLKSIETQNVEGLVCTREEFNSLVSKLKESLEVKLKFLESLSDEVLQSQIYDDRYDSKVSVAWLILRGNLDHEIHHRGQIAVYLRVLEDNKKIIT
jgi:uncharacterized damage-inducible protein DinB